MKKDEDGKTWFDLVNASQNERMKKEFESNISNEPIEDDSDSESVNIY